MLGYLSIIVIVIIAVAAIAGIVIAVKKYNDSVRQIARFKRWIDARTEAGFAEITAIAKASDPMTLKDAITVKATSTSTADGGKFAMFATANSDANVFIGINATGNVVYFIPAKTGNATHILTSDFKFIGADLTTQTAIPSKEEWRISRASSDETVDGAVVSALKKLVPANATPLSALDLAGSDLSRIAVAKATATNPKPANIRAVLARTIHGGSGSAISVPVTLLPTSASNVFYAETAATSPGKDVGFVVIEGKCAYVIDATAGLVIALTADGSAKVVKWPTKVRIPEFFQWSLKL